jgi:predicted ATPase/class 3 adenylate cyclase
VRDDLPTGTVTFLFTDVEGSTKLLRELRVEAYAEALAEHRRLIREACTAEGGAEVDTQGDAFFFAFPTATGALAAAARLTASLSRGPIHVRVGVHTGTPFVTEEGYVGHDVHRAARIAAVGHGGQVLVSASTAQLVELELRNLGEHRPKDLSAPERVYQLGNGEFPALTSLYRTNLPVPATPFLGRDRELSEVVELLSAADVRLLTLTGPGGTGKTRLALQAAGLASDAYPDGVWWVALAPLRDPSLVVATAAQALGSKNGLAEHIADRRMLCLFDNFEQVVVAAPDLSALVSACPNLDVLVTSRERLRVSGEQTYPVTPLAETDGEALFVTRARAVDPSFVASNAIPELCLRLDELPLALELAAARTVIFSPEQLLEKLGQRLDLLKGERDADPRQQTLRATIEWSHDLLSVKERRLFRRLAVFAGGCTYEAAEEVAGADPDTLQSLLDKSLVRKRDSPVGSRYSMLETIGEYAAEQLDASGEAEDTARGHLEHYVALVEGVDARSEDGREYETGLIEDDRDNVRRALDHALAHDPERALELAGALGRYWLRRAHLREGREQLEAALAAAPESPAPARCHALIWATALAREYGDIDAAERFAHAALTLAREHGDRKGAGMALGLLGSIAWLRGDLAAAARLQEDSLAEASAAGDERGWLLGRADLALIVGASGDYPRAIALEREVVARARERQDMTVLVPVLANLGHHLSLTGETEHARRTLEEVVALTPAHHSITIRANALAMLGALERMARPALALKYHREALVLLRDSEVPRESAAALDGLATTVLARGDAGPAAKLLGAADVIWKRAGLGREHWELDDVNATIAKTKAALGEDAFAEAWAEGSALSLPQAIDLGLAVIA